MSRSHIFAHRTSFLSPVATGDAGRDATATIAAYACLPHHHQYRHRCCRIDVFPGIKRASATRPSVISEVTLSMRRNIVADQHHRHRHLARSASAGQMPLQLPNAAAAAKCRW
eukprot:366306-Chlamydomonas_euryale.AAC.5